MTSWSERLTELGIELPAVVPPLAAYVPAVQTGSLVYTAGQLPMVAGKLTHSGKVGADVTAEDAADALQEALLSAHRTAASFRADAAVRSWMHKIVVNACLDRIRRNRSRPTTPLPDGDSFDLADARDSMADVETSIEIHTALMSLAPDQRAAVVAVDMEGYSVADAARLLGVPAGTVKSRCARGRLKLAIRLQFLREDGNR